MEYCFVAMADRCFHTNGKYERISTFRGEFSTFDCDRVTWICFIGGGLMLMVVAAFGCCDVSCWVSPELCDSSTTWSTVSTDCNIFSIVFFATVAISVRTVSFVLIAVAMSGSAGFVATDCVDVDAPICEKSPNHSPVCCCGKVTVDVAVFFYWLWYRWLCSVSIWSHSHECTALFDRTVGFTLLWNYVVVWSDNHYSAQILVR